MQAILVLEGVLMKCIQCRCVEEIWRENNCIRVMVLEYNVKYLMSF